MTPPVPLDRVLTAVRSVHRQKKTAVSAPEPSIAERVAQIVYDRDSFAGDLHWSRTAPDERERCRRIARETLAAIAAPQTGEHTTDEEADR